MKFYSYTNENNNYTKAVSLSDVRAVERVDGNSKSAIRYSVCIQYCDKSSEVFMWLTNEESKKVYKEILNLLNQE